MRQTRNGEEAYLLVRRTSQAEYDVASVKKDRFKDWLEQNRRPPLLMQGRKVRAP